MALCKILVDFQAAEGWKVGDVVEITDPRILLAQKKVELFTEEVEKEKKPVAKKKKKEYVCKECGKVCKTKAGLKSHMRSHE